MSKQSKAKRDARKKKEPARPIRRLGSTLRPHARLVDAAGEVFGGAGFRDGEWLMVLAGQVVARTESAAMMIAMLRHAATVLEGPGRTIALNCSPTLEGAAASEALGEGRTLDEYLAFLEAERAERATRAQAPVALH
jgi:hypothetical protein